MKKIIGALIAATFILLPALVVNAQQVFKPSQGGTGIGSGTAGDLNKCLIVSDESPLTYVFGTCGAGGAGTWTTTASQVLNQLINYSNNNTDIVSIGGNSTSTAKFYFDPNLNLAKLTYASTTALSGTFICLSSDCRSAWPTAYTDAAVNAYIHASTTIPKTYTANTFTGAQVFNGNVTIGSLTGPLQAISGLVSASSTLSVFYGGTGATTIGASSTAALSDGSKLVYYKLSPANFITANISQWTNDSGYLTSAASSTLLGDSNTFTGKDTFARASTTQLTLLGQLYDANNSNGTAGFTLESRGGALAPIWVATTTFSTGLTFLNGAVTCDTASASVFGCLSASKFSKFDSASTTFSTGLTYTGSTNAVTVNTSQNIATLSNLTSNGYVKTSGGVGTLGVQAVPIPVTDGGTGWVAIKAGSIPYGNDGSALATTTAGTSGFVLALNGTTPTWVATTTFTGTSPITLAYLNGLVTGSCTTAASGVAGCLNSTSFDTFNNKQNAITASARTLLWTSDGTAITSTSSIVTVGSLIATTTTASKLPYASTTAITATTASTTSLIVSGLGGATTRCLQVAADGTVGANASACGTGGGSGGGTWATTTSQEALKLINYPLNDTDIVTVGSSATTSAEVYLDPNTNTYKIGTLTGPLQGISGILSATGTLSVFYGGTGATTIGASSTAALSDGSKLVYYKLSPANFITGNISQWTNDSGYITSAASSTLLGDNNTFSGKDTFTRASTTQLSLLGPLYDLVSAGTPGQTLMSLGTSTAPKWTSTTTFSTGVTYLNGNVTCDTASNSVFGCLAAASFSKFNSATTTFGTGVTYTGSTNSVACDTASASVFGCLAAAKFSKFDSATTTAGTGLTFTLSSNTFNVNTSQNISTLSNLTSNGYVKTSGGTGALSVQAVPIPVTDGGTGWVAIKAGSIPYGNDGSALSTTTAGTSGNVLALNGTTPTWVATTTFSSGATYLNGNVTVDLGTSIDLNSAEVTNTLPIVRGGTNSSAISSRNLVWFDGTSITSTSSILTVGSLVATTTASSTFVGGVDAARVCITNGVCLGAAGGAGTVNSGTYGQFAWYAADGTAVSASGTQMTIGNILATSTTATSTINGIFAVGSSTNPQVIVNPVGVPMIGLGTTSPFAQLSVHANNGSTLLNLFAIASSTATATTTPLRMDNQGHLFLTNLTVSGSAQTYYACGVASTFEVVWDTTTCLVSALKFKKDVTPIDAGLDEVLKLRPVNYFLKKPLGTNDAIQQFGFIADEVDKIDSRLVTRDSAGDIHAFRYEQYTAILTKAIQELNDKVERRAEENWQWLTIVAMFAWIVRLEIKKRNKK